MMPGKPLENVCLEKFPFGPRISLMGPTMTDIPYNWIQGKGIYFPAFDWRCYCPGNGHKANP